jgi:hypothetical protein
MRLYKILFILLLIDVIWWSFPILKNRYFNHSNVPVSNNQQSQPSSNPSQPSTANSSDNQSQTANPQTSAILETNPVAKQIKNTPNNYFLHITPADCDSQCKPFIKNKKSLQYCQEVCGLISPIAPGDTCNNLKELDKDYCLKNLAISKKDMTICDQIQDLGIKKNCQNRIIEDMLDQGLSQPT